MSKKPTYEELEQRVLEFEKADSKRKRAEEKLRIFMESVNNSSDAVGMSTPEGKHYYQNKAFDELFGPVDENPPESLYVDPAVGHEVFRAIMAGGQWSGEVQMYAKDRRILDILLRAYANKDKSGHITSLLGIHTDITERKRAEETIKASLHEKEVLLREIHHRVKNNMQVVCGLLSLQATRSESEQVRHALNESQQRVYAMAMVHEELYSGQNLSAIDFSEYLKRLVNHLQRTYNNRADIRITLELEKIELDINQAIPCCLIINELITNAFKHAFPAASKGNIHMKLYIANDKEVVLEFSDNGVGIAANIELSKPSSLGLKLVNELLKKQLKGSLDVSTAGRTAFTLRWPLLGRNK